MPFPGPPLPPGILIDEEISPVYNSKYFYPVKPGEVLADHYQTLVKLVDFGLATRLKEDDDWGVWPNQPDHYRAPEVILGNGWQIPADIWNFGVLLWDMIEGKELFQYIHDEEGRYDPQLHIAEMIALLGPPPPEII
ncbi:kinase-like domain-containing protein [Penicillium sp. IBT 18751x]|nr:kinase-like domain-containing protein [Penicillium sp. IBT 18751x]